MELPLEADELELLRSVVGKHGKLIFGMRCGSWAYNLQTEKSDKDYIGVYIGSYKGPFSMPPSSFDRTGHATLPDYAIYEASVFCELILKGNPHIVEPLFAKHRCWFSEEWVALQAHRSVAINLTSAKQYFGFAYAEIQQMKDPKNADISKPAYRAMRLLSQAERVLQGLPPVVFLEGELRQRIMDIRNQGANADRDLVLAEVEATRSRVASMLDAPSQSIPEQADTKPLSKWAASIRSEYCAQLEKPNFTLEPGAELDELSTIPKDVLLRAQAILDRAGFPNGYLLFVGECGSHAYKLKCATVRDYVCFYAKPSRAAFDPFDRTPSILCEHPNQESNLDIKYKTGLILIEIEEALRQIMRGHHQLIDALHSSKAWMCACMRQFLSQMELGWELTNGHFMHCRGIADQLAAKAIKSGPTHQSKELYLAKRLLLQAEEICGGKFLVESISHDQLTELQLVYNGIESAEEVHRISDAIRTRCSELMQSDQWRRLPKKVKDAQVEQLNTFIVGLRQLT